MLLLTYQRGTTTGHELQAGLCEIGTDDQITQLQPCPVSLQMPPPMHTSSSMPLMLMGTGPSTLRYAPADPHVLPLWSSEWSPSPSTNFLGLLMGRAFHMSLRTQVDCWQLASFLFHSGS